MNHPAIDIGETRTTRFSVDLETTEHNSHALKLLVTLDGDVSVREASGRTVTAPAIVIPSNVTGSARSAGPVVSLLLDPEHHREPNARMRAIGQAVPLDTALTHRLRDAVWASRQHLGIRDTGPLVALGDELQGLVFPRSMHRTAFDRRVERAIERFRVHDPAVDPPLLLDPRMDITLQHFRALFQRDVGISPRAWLVWNRLVRALRVALSGDPALTMAAIEAGFSDHAHFSRTCRRLLGYTPSDLVLPRPPRRLPRGG